MSLSTILLIVCVGILAIMLGYFAYKWVVFNCSPIEKRLGMGIKKAGLPDPVGQLKVEENGRLVTIPDFGYPEHRIAIYADGWKYHGKEDVAMEDAKKRNFLSRSGWIVLVFHGRTINKNMTYCQNEIREALNFRERQKARE